MGLKTGQINSGSFKKGISASPKTKFKKGNVPFNAGKGKKYGIKIVCKTCGKEYVRTKSKGMIYCSNKCQGNDAELRDRISKTCKGFTRNDALKKWRENGGGIGEKNVNWKGGVSKLKIYKHYKNKEYINWRKLVFERDSFTCQKCGIMGVMLHPHHIKGYTKYPEMRYEVDNGITLCVPCHHQTHWGH